MLVSLTLCLGAANTFAQEEDRPRPNREGRPGGPDDRPRGPGQGPGRDGFRPPLMAALDADNDGILSQEEIANASKALLTLDKNKDGQVTPDEYRPGRPPEGRRFNRGDRPGRGPGGADDEDRPRRGRP